VRWYDASAAGVPGANTDCCTGSHFGTHVHTVSDADSHSDPDAAANPDAAADPDAAAGYIRLCFALPSENEIWEGVEKLADVFRREGAVG
jgi:hypothetical protein